MTSMRLSSRPSIVLVEDKPKERRPLEAITPRAFTVLPSRAIYDPDLGPGAFRVLAAIGHHANRAGLTWVSQQKIAAMMGLGRSSISDHFKTLRDTGYIETVHKSVRGAKSATVRVIFNPTISARQAIIRSKNISDDTNLYPFNQPSIRNQTMPRGRKKTVDNPPEQSGLSDTERLTLRTKEEREELRRKVKESYAAEGLSPPDERIQAEVDEMLRRLAGS